MPTARATLDRFARIRPARLSRARRDESRNVVLADLDGGAGRGGLLGATSPGGLNPAGPIPIAAAQPLPGAGGLLAPPPAVMSPNALQSGLQLAQSAKGIRDAYGAINRLSGGTGAAGVGAGGSGLGGVSAAAPGSSFSMAPAIVGGGSAAGGAVSAAPLTAAGAAPVVEPIGGLGGAAPAVAAGGLAAAAPLLAFGAPAAAFAVASRFDDAAKSRGSFKVDSSGKITHRNIKDAGIASKAAFNDFADWVGRSIADSGANVPSPDEVSFGVRGGQVYLQPAGSDDRQFFDDPRDLLSALTGMAGRPRDFSGIDVPDFSQAGRDAAQAEADRLTGVVGGRTPALGGPLSGDIFAPTGMIGRLGQAANVQGLIDQPEFFRPRVAAGGLLGP